MTAAATQLWNGQNNQKKVLRSSSEVWFLFLESLSWTLQWQLLLSLSFSHLPGAGQHYIFNGWLVSDVWLLLPEPQLWEIALLFAPDVLGLEFPEEEHGDLEHTKHDLEDQLHKMVFHQDKHSTATQLEPSGIHRGKASRYKKAKSRFTVCQAICVKSKRLARYSGIRCRVTWGKFFIWPWGFTADVGGQIVCIEHINLLGQRQKDSRFYIFRNIRFTALGSLAVHITGTWISNSCGPS